MNIYLICFSLLIAIHSETSKLNLAALDDNEQASSSTPTSGCCTETMHKITFLSEMILGFDLIFVFIFSSALTYGVNYVGSESNKWLSYLTASSSAVGTLGALFSFALVFRTNICYARWWEGRTLWGAIIVNSIRICQQSRLWIHDDLLNDRVDCLAITFAFVCKAMLRSHCIGDDEEDGKVLVRKGVLAQEELDVITQEAAWQPYYCIDALRATINEGLVRTEHKISYDGRKNAAHTAMEETVGSLANAIGGCIRVRSTGLPVAYDIILNSIGFVFFTAATLAWSPGAKYYNPILVSVIYIAMKMIIGVGNDMEDPFGLDESDLPLESFCSTIESQINAIEERRHVVNYDLAYGPRNAVGEFLVSVSRASTPSRQSTPEPGTQYDVELGHHTTENDPLVRPENPRSSYQNGRV